MGKIMFSELQKKEWLIEQIKTKPKRQIADEVGCSYAGVTYALKRFGISVPIRKTHRKVDKSQSIKDGIKKSYPNGRFGKDAANWKGGKRKANQAGYIYIHRPNHPNATKDGYVMEHRLKMEEKIGRVLKQTEYVHHINGNKKDNRIENLELMKNRREHSRRHFDAVKEVDRLKRILDKHRIAY